MNHNTVLSVAHYEQLGLPVIHSRKEWETRMAMRALQEFGALHDDSFILGTGAGREQLIYLLSNHARFVFATDLYLEPGRWKDWHNVDFLACPGRNGEQWEHNPRRIIPMHMDGRELIFENETFDGYFSSSSIEHFGLSFETDGPDWESVEKAAREMGRVLKPGGIATLSTEFKFEGVGWGFDIVRLFDRETLMRHIVEPSGLELVDELILDIDDPTRETAVDMSIYHHGKAPPVEAVISFLGYAWTSVHLALRKPTA